MQKNLDGTLIKAVKILNKNKINYWICHGTLLGIIRNKNVISKSSDIDIAIWNNKIIKNKIYKIFLRNGFKKKKKFFSGDNLLTFVKKNEREIDVTFYEKDKLNKYAFFRNYHFRNYFCRIIDVLTKSKNYNGNYKFIIIKLRFLSLFARITKKYLIKKKYYYTQYGYFVPVKFFSDFTILKVKSLKMRVPKNYYGYIRFLFGKSWRIPNRKKYNWIKDNPHTKKINF